MSTTIVIDHRNKTDKTAAVSESGEVLYAPRTKIFPQSVRGKFRTIKWALLAITLGIYYILPFIRWDRGPTAPDQAVLVDLTNGRFYFFFIEIWPQEVYYITGLLIIASLVLFLMNAVAGRIWCGYLCPQTVWTDLFMWVERLVEGDRRQRMALEAAPWTAGKIARRTLKHTIWLAIAWWTGGAWVLYFADAPTLVYQLATFQASMMVWMWIGILTSTTYLLAGHMREQVCTYMCPWPRIQASLTDEHALNVTYRYDRGEPRESLKKSLALRGQGLPAGDCIDCMQCVNTCPTGVDIRLGPQLACINCGLCIDACDNVMAKIGRPLGLIAYDNDLNVRRREEGKPEIRKIIRPRTILYAALIALVAGIMLAALGTRSTTGVNVLHDRNPIYVQLADGSIRNAYTVRVLNKELLASRFALTVQGVPNARVEIIGDVAFDEGRPVIDVGSDQTREVRVLVTAHRGDLPAQASLPITINVTPVEGARGQEAVAKDFFKGP
ncbi:cytochrome c oxidase accessory protein CcoG [Terrihabitans sp. B22-R8]|uniref:cytochrome c oxidase accessory protein CcoG n=1 Tax=Terrihabitans sp. B22-R8 TaxID=3425128 RepID=UPI00403CFB26